MDHGIKRRDFIRNTAALGVGFWADPLPAFPRLALLAEFNDAPPGKDYPLRPVPFTEVRLTDAFWGPRQEINRTVTLPHCFKKCKETGRIDNFAKAGGLMEGIFRGSIADDSDVYKVLEAASFSLAAHPDPELGALVDDVIAKIAAAQEPDGYLYTPRKLMTPEQLAKSGAGPERWVNLVRSHELYCAGHMFEAAAAHFQATGKRSLLDVAIKNADLLCKTFGPGKNGAVPGHQEIEMGLVKLFRLTGEERHLKLAKFFVDERGNAAGHKLYGQEHQDHKPLIEQTEPVGHSVRAGYFYSGAADAAALTGDEAVLKAVDRIWESMASSKMHLTGGLGSKRSNEGFANPYELPNRCYNETCAAISNVFWCHRMFLLHGDARYADVMERVLYNGFLSGVSLSGDGFFYPNRLSSFGKDARTPWFETACCPTNVVRLMASLGGYFYAVRGDEMFVSLYASGTAKASVAGTAVTLTQETRYPWDGKVTITVAPEKPAAFALRLRIPGWVRGEAVPTDLYRYVGAQTPAWSVSVDGKAVSAEIEKGYAVLRREWKPGDVVVLDLPMAPRRVTANEKVAANRGRTALERGPIVYCFEGVDNGGKAEDIVVAPGAEVTAEHRSDLLNGVTVLRVKEALAIPYFAWANRGKGSMEVWMATEAR